jgi:hypothetical protein
MDGVPADLSGIEIDIEIVSPDPDEKTAPMLAAWRERCPIFLALLKPNAVAFSARVAAPAA